MRARWMGLLVLLAAPGAAPGAGLGAEDSYSATYGSCLDASAGVTVEMLDCVAAEMQVQDRLLNTNYQQLMKAVAASRQGALRDAQRAWLKFRELNCHFYADPDGGSFVQVSVNSCVLDATMQRAAELSRLMPPE